MDTTSKIAVTPANEIPYPSDWPPEEFFQRQSAITLDHLTGLRELVEHQAGEKQIDQFIRDNPTCRVSRHREQSKTAESHDIVNKIKG